MSDIRLDAEAMGLVRGPLGVAVSGGGDSVALLHLLVEAGHRPSVVTVDHGLRPESAAEAEGVARLAAGLGLSHDTLRIGEPLRGNLQDAARTMRRRLIGTWARERGIGTVALGHTADDQAETFLMRLSRGSGLEGLSAMEPAVEAGGILWLRPMLHLRREALRDWLRGRGIAWVDDPSNEDDRFDRVKMREALETLAATGISVPRIAGTAKRLRSAKMVLYAATRDLALSISEITGAGELLLQVEPLRTAQQAVRLRLLSEAIRFIAAADYPPRAQAVEEIIAGLETGIAGRTLSGTQLRQIGATLAIRREPGAVGGPRGVGELWDDRWIVTGPDRPGLEVRALGEAGLSALNSWRDAGFPREALLASPGVWEGDRLISAPIAGHPAGYAARFTPVNPFFTPQAHGR